MEPTQHQKENTDPVFYIHNSNSNFPGLITTYQAVYFRVDFSTPKAIHLYNINGIEMGFAR